jgi:hypothetical protein
MIPQAVIPEEEYLTAFRKYVFALSRKWLGLAVESVETAVVLEKIKEVSSENYRATYLAYLLPIVDSRFVKSVTPDTRKSMYKVLYSMSLNGMPYNDFMLNRFCEILLQAADKKGLFAMPLPEDYKDLQKLIWTFVQGFKKEATSRNSRDHDVI